MTGANEIANGICLLRQGRSDEEVERLTGLTLLKVVELRANLAGATRIGPILDVDAGLASSRNARSGDGRS